MIQCEIKPNDNYSLAEEAQICLEAGVKWLIINLESQSFENFKDDLSATVEVCKEVDDAMISIVDEAEAAKAFRLHGVLLSSGGYEAAEKCREELGPEAAIGVIVSPSDKGICRCLMDADIDYAALDYNEKDMEAVIDFISSERLGGLKFPIVLRGDFSKEEIDALLATGASGFELKGIFDRNDPESSLKGLMSDGRNAE